MLEQNMQENINSKSNLVNQIDNIINKYKTQLEEMKTYSNQNIQDSNIETLPMLSTETVQSRTLSTLIGAQDLKNENLQNNTNNFSSELTKEIKNDNLKLQSALTSEKLNSVKLNSQIENYIFELNKSKQEISDLQNQLINQENEFMNQMNIIKDDINIIKEENKVNINIIKKFFELYNKNILLFNKSKIISYN